MAATFSTLRRVTLALSVVAILALLLQIAVVIVHYGNDRDYLDRAKTDQEVEAIASALSLGKDGSVKLKLPEAIAQRYRRYPQAYGFVVTDDAGKVLAEANPAVFPSEPSAHDRRADYYMTCSEASGERLCVSSRHVGLHGRSVWVRVAVGGDPAGIVLGVFVREVVEDVGVPILPVLLAMLVVNVAVVRRALRPLGRAAAEARRLDPGIESQRLSEDGLPSEVLSLVRSINDMLARTEHVLLAQREFTANAAHELRTPIAILMLRLGEIEGEAAERMRKDLKTMSRQVDQLLELAKIDAIVVAPDSRVDLGAAARDTVEALAILAVDRGRELAYEDEGASTVHGSKDAVQLALRNLIDNAIRHSPPGATVRVVAGPGPQLQVIDQGSGIPAQQRDRIFQRFWRGSQNEGSAGLGLAIVKHVAESHRARVVISDSAGGGTHFRLIFDGEAVAAGT